MSPSSLVNEYAYATECQLATLGMLMDRKSSSKSDIQRQKNICVRMLGVCKANEADVDWRPGFGAPSILFPRLKEILDAADLGLETAMMRRMEGAL